jgi:hypothetical protein
MTARHKGSNKCFEECIEIAFGERLGHVEVQAVLGTYLRTVSAYGEPNRSACVCIATLWKFADRPRRRAAGRTTKRPDGRIGEIRPSGRLRMPFAADR